MSFVNNVKKFVPDLERRRILDLGCGRGDDLIELVRNGYNAIGLDTNQEYLDIVREKSEIADLTVELVKGEAENLPFGDQSFDFIVCSEVTEHVEDPEKILKECYRVLKLGGKAYVSFHNRFGPYDHHYHLWFINWMPRRLADKIISIIGKEKNSGDKIGRQKLSKMHYFTYGCAEKLIKECGFEYLDMRETQVRNPQLSTRRVLQLISRFGLNSACVYLVRKFIGTFHFILTKR